MSHVLLLLSCNKGICIVVEAPPWAIQSVHAKSWTCIVQRALRRFPLIFRAIGDLCTTPIPTAIVLVFNSGHHSIVITPHHLVIQHQNQNHIYWILSITDFLPRQERLVVNSHVTCKYQPFMPTPACSKTTHSLWQTPAFIATEPPPIGASLVYVPHP